jgi:Zn-dependent protease with chaperone function
MRLWTNFKPIILGGKLMNVHKQVVAAILAMTLTFYGCGGGTLVKPVVPVAAPVFNPLQQDLQKSYLELFRLAPKLEYTSQQINEMRDYLNKAQDYCTGEFKKRGEQYDSELRQAEQQLTAKSATLSDKDRQEMHCNIQNLRILKSQTGLLSQHAIPTAYENKKAKLDLIQNWPGDLKQIHQEIADGSYKNRRWGNVRDIGFRDIAPGQKDDIKTGEEAIKQMKEQGLIPPELADKAVVDYVDQVALRVAKHSDLQVPLHVTVLDSKEINAFALPGGFLYVEKGLLDAVDDEAELAGVMGHEIGHVCARHGHKLMVRSTIASIFFQAAEMAAVIFTGGAAGIGAYYALQYGFYGLGMLLDLRLLGVSREFELQADQLGIDYAWNSGYDPSGFVRFFDKMATKEGYVNGMSWFYDHPPFYQRMLDAEREIMFLPPKKDLTVNTPQFKTMHSELVAFNEKVKKEKGPQFNPLAPLPGCTAPKKEEYKPGEPIENLCSLPASLGSTSK